MGYGYIRERVVPVEETGKPNITSLADVTLTLLVIFLVSAAAAAQLIKVDLPEGGHAATRDVNLAVALSLSEKGEFFFEDDTTAIQSKNLWTALKEIKGNASWPMALIRADKKASCRDVNILVQCLQGLGVDEICFKMREAEE